MLFSLFRRRILCLSNRRLTTSSARRNNGYIVLVPEIGEESADKNPLIGNDGLPEFNDVTIEQCMVSISKQAVEFESGVQNIEQILQQTESVDVFKQIINPLEELGCSLDFTWGLSKTLYLGNSSLMPVKNYLAIHDRAKRARACKFNKPIIYRTAKEELDTNKTRSSEEIRILKKFVLEGKLNGLELKENEKALLQEHLNKLSAEKSVYKQKIEVSTKQFSHLIKDGTLVRDFPVSILKHMTTTSISHPHNGPWKVTLQPKLYQPVMEYCPERAVRWNLWQALVSRGSGYSNREFVTSTHLETIRSIRNDIAKLIGYETFADMSMETKMAGNIDNVKSMIQTLLSYSKPAQDQEIQSLLEFARERGFKDEKLELWDLQYWRRKQLKTLYDYNEEAFKNYFPLTKVLEGLFQLCEKLFDIKIKLRPKVPTWHKDVKFFEIFETHSSAPIAGFYLDSFARRDEKQMINQGSGWMVGIQNNSYITNTKPLAALIFNFEAPTHEKPCHLYFKEVVQLFHKFGQVLQHLLTRTTYSEVAGLSNVEWDAVEICGHVLTHWLYNKEVLESISAHCVDHNALPLEMFEDLLRVRDHMVATDLCHELYLSSLDLELHSTRDFWLDTVKRLWEDYYSFTLHKVDSHPCSFTQIFTEEWAAAYFSHVWSRMIAADVYSAFEEVQGDEKKVIDIGKRFRETFLMLGGSCHPSQVFRQFRGRDPSPKALLCYLSLGNNEASISQ